MSDAFVSWIDLEHCAVLYVIAQMQLAGADADDLDWSLKAQWWREFRVDSHRYEVLREVRRCHR